MKESRSDDPIERLRREPIPPSPGSLDDNVWRKIRQRSASEADGSWWGWIDALLPQRRFLMSAAAVALVVSAGTASLTLSPTPPDRSEYARAVLDFQSLTHAPKTPFDRP